MSGDYIEGRLKAMIVENLVLNIQPEEIGDKGVLFKIIGLESVQLIKIATGLEEIFGIQIGDGEFSIKKPRTVKNITEVVRAKTQGGLAA